ncbi:tRNA-dihydrouridine(47) synthase [NAD(P)(+)]-like [Impatiens glandulifera]|uniref:tRNA-dihydrouridine(47) synthase [NAD(P)(+)]-like n=1 Tax=Impatiens glandulifera TaxID=253017 RepID=UPI001FB1395F|nr:tRNA-dihydrouridine(47) synthase [NAD(P)(+)]-like [Impatiens glandulifera]
MDDSHKEVVVVVETETVSQAMPERTPEELVAKAIAPVKKDFIRPPPIRNKDTDTDNVNDLDTKPSAPSKIIIEKKSKRQLKRERNQEKASTKKLCPEVARTGDVNLCPYKDNCRHSHDIEAFKSQKLADIDGDCPFLADEKACPYGLGCRFSGTHKYVFSADEVRQKERSETNTLSKEVQRLLWKNKMEFPKADAQLTMLGLMGNKNSISKLLPHAEEDSKGKPNGSAADIPLEENDESVEGELRPVKKVKASDENDENVTMNDVEKCQPQSDEGTTAERDSCLKLHPREKKLIDFRDKLYLAPLTTVGNLPFRRICKVLGADVTCGEMAMCTNLLQGQASEWALLRRHSSEDLFGVQICGSHPDTVARTVELIDQECEVDFIDINMGCPIDIVVDKGAGSSLLTKPMRMKNIIQTTSSIVDKPIVVKVRTGYLEGRNRIDSLIADIGQWGASALTIHGRSRQQRYSKLADWEYIYTCTRKAPDSLQVLGNGDIFSYVDYNIHKSDCPELSTCMIARGALIKPWIFTEIKEQRHWDISSSERLDIFKSYVRFGLQHWGSDTKGVETTRHFLLEWLSYTHRYIPVGLLDVIPQKLNWRPPSYFGRDDLETLMASDSAADWVRISEMLLGKVPDGFTFAPKHKSNAYDRAENG